MAEWFAQGFLRRLLSDDPAAVELRSLASFYVVPNMNPGVRLRDPLSNTSPLYNATASPTTLHCLSHHSTLPLPPLYTDTSSTLCCRFHHSGAPLTTRVPLSPFTPLLLFVAHIDPAASSATFLPIPSLLQHCCLSHRSYNFAAYPIAPTALLPIPPLLQHCWLSHRSYNFAAYLIAPTALLPIPPLRCLSQYASQQMCIRRQHPRSSADERRRC